MSDLFSSGVSLAFNCSFCFFFSSFNRVLSVSSRCSSFSSSSLLLLLLLLLEELCLFFFFLLFLCFDSFLDFFLSRLRDLCLDFEDLDLLLLLLTSLDLPRSALLCSSERLRDRSLYLLTDCFDDL